MVEWVSNLQTKYLCIYSDDAKLKDSTNVLTDIHFFYISFVLVISPIPTQHSLPPPYPKLSRYIIPATLMNNM